MAKNRNEDQGRRDVLRAGAVAVGAALLPRTAAAEQVGTAAPDYQRRIEKVAEELRLGFRAGQFRGFTDEDERRSDDNAAYITPRLRLEGEVAARLLGHQPTAHDDMEEAAVRRAAWVLMNSPSIGELMSDGYTVEGFAISAATWDVLRIARERRWYTPAPGECPSNKDLGVRS